MKPLVCALVSAVVLSFAAFAQTDLGSITGTITDQTGAVVPNAKIEVKNSANGQTFAGGTSATGNYVISLPAGMYELEVTVTGFKKFVRTNLQVTVASDTRQDVTLTVGNASESVTVTDVAPLLKTESGEMSHNVTSEDANQLPVLTLAGPTAALAGNGFGNIRDPLAITQLLPGVFYGGADGGMAVNGLPASTDAIRIEGQDANNGTWNQKTQINQSGMDAIQEVSVQTSNFAAEYGQVGGGYLNLTMKSGTNQFHGSDYLYLVNEALNAGLPFTDAGISDSRKEGQHIRNPERRFDYGATLGGPIDIPKVYNGQNKSFFFFNFERYQETQTFVASPATVPTDAYRKGDFSGAELAFFGPLGGPGTTDAAGQTLFRNEIFDPTTTHSVGGDIVRTPFMNGIIPPTSLNKVALAIQNLVPAATLPGSINNYLIPTFSDYQHTTNWSTKVDHSLSPTIKLSGYFSHILTFNPNENGVTPTIIAQPSATNNSSSTIRVNYDQTVKPTLLLHLGVGYIHTYIPSTVPQYNESSLGLTGYYANYFPNISGLSDPFSGGLNLSSSPFGGGALGPGGFLQNLWDEKPTANANLTWIKNNHTFKFGSEMMIEGFPDISVDRSNGSFAFSSTETGNPDENRLGLNAFTGLTGFPYASFLLGQVDNLNINPPQQSKLGDHSIAFYAQDSWKVTRKLTVDYGLRWDYETYLKEQYGRMPDTVFNVANPAVGGRNGATLFEGSGPGRCNCAFSHNYPYAWGPRLGVAYQIASGTVLRGGFGVNYAQASNNAFLSYNDTVFYSLNGSSYGIPFMTFGPNPFAPGNSQGNAALVYPYFNAGVFPVAVGGQLVPDSPFINIDRSSRPPRILTWSVSLQRELSRNLLIDVSYVGNRGAYFTAPILDTIDYNALNLPDVTRNGLNIHSAGDQQLLLTPINSPAVIQKFPNLANPASVYAGFPADQPLNQALRPAPQFIGVPPFLGPPDGDTWYNSLQVKVTKRFSHGLSAQGSYVWNKNEVLGVSAASQYFTPGLPVINDVYNRNQNKQLAQNGAPQAIVISGTYTTPAWEGANKVVSNVLRGWQISALLRYQSGALIQTPDSSNNLLSELGRGPSNNPALWGGGNTFENVVPGQNFFLVNPNTKGFDPTTQLALNPKAFADVAGGEFGVAAPFYNQNRWQRQPAESMSFGRNFRMGKEGRYNFQVRMEFQNIFNRLAYSMPAAGGLFGGNSTTTPTANMNPGGTLSAGYGFVPWINGAGDTPRSGQAVARFTF